MYDEKTLKETFARNLQTLMSVYGTTEMMLSDGTGISQGALNRMKNGKVTPSLYQAALLADYFNISIGKLLSNGNINQFNDDVEGNDNYVPIVDSEALIKKGHKNVIGFYQGNKQEVEDHQYKVIGFKVDGAFSSRALNKNSIVIAQQCEIGNLKEGDFVLFYDMNNFRIGSMVNNYIRLIDNLAELCNPQDVLIIGKVLKMETEYIKNKKIVDQLKSSISVHYIDRWLQNKNLIVS